MKTYLNISSKVNDVLFTFFDRATDKDIVCFLSMTPQIIEPLVKGDFLCHAASWALTQLYFIGSCYLHRNTLKNDKTILHLTAK